MGELDTGRTKCLVVVFVQDLIEEKKVCCYVCSKSTKSHTGIFVYGCGARLYWMDDDGERRELQTKTTKATFA